MCEINSSGLISRRFIMAAAKASAGWLSGSLISVSLSMGYILTAVRGIQDNNLIGYGEGVCLLIDCVLHYLEI